MSEKLSVSELEELSTIELDVVAEITKIAHMKPLHYDPEKLQYNQKYKCFDYFAKKFPDGWESIPGFDKVIEMCQRNGSKLTPLQEMELKRPDIYISER